MTAQTPNPTTPTDTAPFDQKAAKRREERGIIIAAMCKLRFENGV